MDWHTGLRMRLLRCMTVSIRGGFALHGVRQLWMFKSAGGRFAREVICLV